MSAPLVARYRAVYSLPGQRTAVTNVLAADAEVAWRKAREAVSNGVLWHDVNGRPCNLADADSLSVEYDGTEGMQ